MKNLIKIAVITVAMGTMLASCNWITKPGTEKPIDTLKTNAVKIDSTKKDTIVKVDSTKKDTSKK